MVALDSGTHKSQLKGKHLTTTRHSERTIEHVAYALATRVGEYTGHGNNLNKRKSAMPITTLQTQNTDPIAENEPEARDKAPTPISSVICRGLCSAVELQGRRLSIKISIIVSTNSGTCT